MSDLIENLIQKLSEVEAARGPAKHILNERLADLGQVAWDHWEEIVEALETVRGIEEIMQKDTHFSLYRGGFKYYVQVRNSDRSIDFMVKVPVEDGPSAAVEAARAKK